MDKKAILYVGGGAMAGVFGAGVVTGLQEGNVYSKLSHVYGASAGAFDIAYFLAKQTKKGSTIYWEDLVHDFIDVSNFPKILAKIVLGKKDFKNVVDIDYLIKVSKTAKDLDLGEIKRSVIEAKVKVYDLEEKKLKYLDLKKNPFQRLKESSSVAPYFYSEGQRNIDGDILNSLDYDYLRKKHPDQKLIFVLNHRVNRSFFSRARKFLEGKLVARLFESPDLKQRFRDEGKNMNEDVKKISSDENALLITPSRINPSNNSTTDSEKLIQTHKLGFIEAQKILDFLE